MAQDFLKNIFHKAKKDTFLKSSALLFFGSLFVGVANYIYQFLMARMLSVSAYGETQSLLAIFSIISVFSSSISVVVIKYTADFMSKNQLGKIRALLFTFLKKIFFATVILYILFVFGSGFIAEFLNLHSVSSVILLGIGFFFSFSTAITLGVVRGVQKFKEFSIVSILQSISKLVIALVLVKLGFDVFGAVGAVVISSLVAFLLSFYPLRFLSKQVSESLGGNNILKYSFPVFFTMLATTLFWSIDIIMVKHFFSPQIAGEYSALAMMGRIIFFVVGPIISVMFPMAADAHATSGFPAKILKKAIILISGIGGGIVGGYFLFPEVFIRILASEKFLAVSPYLGFFALSMLLYSFVNLFSNYFLSIGKIGGTYRVCFGAVLLLVGILLFHQSIGQVAWVMFGVMSFTLILLIQYFWQIYYLCPKK